MNCLCCGKPLRTDSDTCGWHKSCIKRFFGTASLPEIDINNDTLELLALENTSKGYTVPGVQKKLSLHLLSEGTTPRLTLVNYPTGYILKPQVEEFDAMPEAEHLVMSMADISGIATVPHALIRMGDEFAYLSKRVDRVMADNRMKMLAMEDFCQLDLRLTQDKYRGSYERCAKVIDRYSSRRGLDMAELYMRLIFCYLTGNSDMHLKNFSLLETDEGSREYNLSPAYDLLPVNVIMPEDTEEFALAMNGKKSRLNKHDFFVFAEECCIEASAAQKMIGKLMSLTPQYIAMCQSSLLPQEMKDQFITLIETRRRTFEV